MQKMLTASIFLFLGQDAMIKSYLEAPAGAEDEDLADIDAGMEAGEEEDGEHDETVD